MFVVAFRMLKAYLMLCHGLHKHEFKMTPREDHSVNYLNRSLPTGILKTGKTSTKLSTTSELIGNK